MPPSTTLFIAACSTLVASAGPSAGPLPVTGSGPCVTCHVSARQVVDGVMATRAGERAFARRAFGDEGERVFASTCNGCHVSGCESCHEAGAGFTRRPSDDACLRCHRGDSAGWELHGRAPREDHPRYRRGRRAEGEPYLSMLPDVHQERGMTCAYCHPMATLGAGRAGARRCTDCHTPSSGSSPEHAIAAHLSKLACVACHAAWAAQEYGTFLVKADDNDELAMLPRWGAFYKSAHLRRQDAPSLGLDAAGLVAPIRPRYVLFVTDPSRGWENRLLAAEWRAFAPHTVRRGSVPCGSCHDNPRRFLLEPDEARIYWPDADGLPLRSYWSGDGQRVTNGAFFPQERFQRSSVRTPDYARKAVQRWKALLNRAAARSAR